MHQIHLEDHLVINHLGIDRLPQNDASLANALGKTLFHQLLLFLRIVGQSLAGDQWIIRKKGRDVNGKDGRARIDVEVRAFYNEDASTLVREHSVIKHCENPINPSQPSFADKHTLLVRRLMMD